MSMQRAKLEVSDLYQHLVDEVFLPYKANEDRVGIEVEFFPMLLSHLNTGAAQPKRNEGSGFMGLYPWLLLLADRHGWKPASVESSAAIAFVLPKGGRVMLEPGGQIEYSTLPRKRYQDALSDAEEFEQLLTDEGRGVGLTFLAEGFNSRLGSATPRLIVEKPRYLLMDKHFAEIGPYGRMMMRQTCATQINLDFGAPEIATERWKLANLVASPLNALFANSPHLLDETCRPSFRYEIWRRTDPCRTNFPQEAIHSLNPAEAYLRFALDASVLVISDEIDGFRSPDHPMTFHEWMTEGERSYPDIDDWCVHLTTLFPDVRPRGFIEIRSIDALSTHERHAVVVLTTGLLYNNKLRRRGLELLKDPVTLSQAEPTASWENRYKVGQKLLEIGLEELESDELIWYHEEYAVCGKTPADSMVELIDA